MPGKRDLPSTVKRSPEKAQRTYAETLESADEEYGSGERASRTAYSALKHSYAKVGDHWEPKDEKGPSDQQSQRSTAAKRDRPLPTAEGVDANASKAHLMDVAKKLDVRGRSSMNKDELIDAIKKANRRETAERRG